MSDYGSLINPAMPGVIADTGDYNVDGSCFNGANKIATCGKFAWCNFVQDGQYKEIFTEFSQMAHVPHGIVLRSQYCTNVDTNVLIGYAPGEPVNLLTHGRAWVLSQNIDTPPEPYSQVHFSMNGMASKGGSIAAGWLYTGGWMKWDSQHFIVEVQVIQSGAHLVPTVPELVASAKIKPSHNSPAPRGTQVTFDIEVLPESAKDKTGTWLYNDHAGRITGIGAPNGGFKLIPGTFTGTTTIQWVSNDGSNVKAEIEFTWS